MLAQYGGGTWPMSGSASALTILPYNDFPCEQTPLRGRGDYTANARTGPCKDHAPALASFLAVVKDQMQLQRSDVPLACLTALFAAGPRLHHIRVTLAGRLRRMTVHETEPFRGCGLQLWSGTTLANLAPDLTTALLAA